MAVQETSLKTGSLNNLRRVVLVALAVVISLPIALISSMKILLLVTSIAVFWTTVPKPLQWKTQRPSLNIWIYLSSLAMLCSLLWTSAPDALMWKSLNRHSTLLFIPLFYFMVQSKQEAIWTFRGYVLGHLFVVASTSALFAGLELPWQTDSSDNPDNQFAVFSSYLDQSIMTSVYAAILWHGRSFLPSTWQRYGVVPTCLAAIACVFFLLPGRTGQLVGLGMFSLYGMWLLPTRLRMAALGIPIFISIIFSVISTPVQNRFKASWNEAQKYAQGDTSPTSIGFRLEAWRSAIISIQQHPLIGTGVGSWGPQYDAIQSAAGRPNETPTDGNPHQEFLLWGVELGIGGIILLLGILASIFRLSLYMETASKRATQSTLLALVIACSFNCALYDALIGDYLCVTLALCLVLGLKTDELKYS